MMVCMTSGWLHLIRMLIYDGLDTIISCCPQRCDISAEDGVKIAVPAQPNVDGQLSMSGGNPIPISLPQPSEGLNSLAATRKDGAGPPPSLLK